MTDDLIKRLAEEAGFEEPGYPEDLCDKLPALLRRFAGLVAEECAKECEARGRSYREAKAPGWHEVDHEAAQHAYAIRAKFKDQT